MKWIVFIILIGGATWVLLGRPLLLAHVESTVLQLRERPVTQIAQSRPEPAFKCDGRQYCSQMTSCKEATTFLRNCPDMKMDGDHDGVPCESQWCQ
jgi:hypothetical protein